MSVFDPFPELATPRLRLRAITPDDAADMFRVHADPEVIRFLGRLPMASIDAARERIDTILTNLRGEISIGWTLVDASIGAYVGGVSLMHWDKAHSRAEVGYVVAKEHWGRGLVPEALGAILQFGFERMKLHSVEARIHPDNRASRRVAEKLGFVEEGYFRESYFNTAAGTFEDTVVYSLLVGSFGRAS